MESVFDTETPEIPEDTENNEIDTEDETESLVQDSTEIISGANIDKETNLSLLDNVDLRTTETVVNVASEPKQFEQSGFEVAVVLCLAIIIGLYVFDMLSKRWHT